MKADSKSGFSSKNLTLLIYCLILLMFSGVTFMILSDGETTLTKSENAITPTLSLTLRVSSILKAANRIFSSFVKVDLELSKRIITFLAPEAAIVYQGLVLGS